MRRPLAKLAFLLAAVIVTTGATVFVSDIMGLPSGWHALLAGIFGACIGIGGGRVFDRIWQKPRAGWAS